jgi:hypothetical protein
LFSSSLRVAANIEKGKMMPSIGTITANLHTVDRDEVVYGRSGNSVSHADVIALRRTMPVTASKPLRTNIRFERGFAPTNVAETGEKPVTVSIACTVPPGIDDTATKAYIAEALTQAATAASELALSGDIHL